MSDKALSDHMALQQANQHNHKTPSRPVEDNTAPAAIKSIDDTFTRLKAICVVGSAFKTPQEEHVVKQEWMLALREEGITKKFMIDDGVEFFRIKSRKTKGATWFPSIGEFVDACLGSDDTLQFAERSYNLFIKRQKQLDNVGREMLIEHRFNLRSMNAEKGKVRFIELYLEFASKMPLEQLDAFALTETVQLSPEQEKAKQNRTEGAKNEFFAKFNRFTKLNPEIPPEAVEKAVGIKQGSLKTYNQTQKQADENRERQLKAAGIKL